MLSIFQDAAKGILELMGEDALFTGESVPVKVNIERGVQLTGIDGEQAQYRGDMVAIRDVATLLPGRRKGATFVQGGKSYVLEFPVSKDGALERWVVLEV